MRHRILLFLFLSIATASHAGKVDTLRIYSPSMQKEIPCLVITPDDYTVLEGPYPVLYLLHGWSGNYSGWLKDAPQLQKQADNYRMIIVCPDGGYDSWYFDSPVDSSVRYETHITKEVIPWIDGHYFTRKEPAGRAIAGLSMGGHGAVFLAARHPELFGAAGSMAGGLDLRPFRKNNWNLEGRLGKPETNWENWEQYSVVNLIPEISKTRLQLIIDCGTADFFLDVNREMHQELLKAGFPHDYTERPGAHNGAYWGSAVDFQIVYFDKFFRK